MTSNQKSFVELMATYVKKYAPQYNILVYSPIIAQAIHESAFGTSELATKAYNYFGLKYCARVTPQKYVKVGSEQNADGSYITEEMTWCKFNSMEDGVKGYFDFINYSRYDNLKGVFDPQTYVENIKVDGYATSLTYVDSIMSAITNYDLTAYDDYKLDYFIRDTQRILGAKVDGIVGKETLSKTITLSKKVNAKTDIVNFVQKRLNSLGYDCGTVDSIAGSKFDKAVRAFQKDNHCFVDGEITQGQLTWQKLLGI